MTSTCALADCDVILTGRAESLYCSAAHRQRAYRDRTRAAIAELKKQAAGMASKA